MPERDLRAIIHLAKENNKLNIQNNDPDLATLIKVVETGDSTDALWSALAALCWHARRVGTNNGFDLL